MALATVLVVEDDAAIRRGLVDALSVSGYRVIEREDGAAGLEAALSIDVDIVLLDILMPKMEGTAVLAELRKSRPGLPVIFLTAKGQESDRVSGLRGGADDYVVKPFSIKELIARVEAVLRRTPERPEHVENIDVAGRHIDFARREVTHEDGERSSLSERECDVLSYLVANKGRAVARDELLSRVWGLDPRGVHTRTVDMTIARLRELLRDSSSDPSVIVTVRGKGYMLASETVKAGATKAAAGNDGA